jgi:hypothetical protein
MANLTNSTDEALGMVRVSHPALSLWQSAVRQVVASRVSNGDITDRAVAIHPAVRQADDYVKSRASAGRVEVQSPAALTVNDNPFEIALAHAESVIRRVEDFATSIGKFTNLDPLFLECIFEFIKYYWLSHLPPQYRDWNRFSEGINLSVVPDPIPDSAKVAVIGDWGTGMDDAEWLLTQILVSAKPDALIHLGDVYYSGTAAEVHQNFAVPIARAAASAGVPTLRIYAIPGNHDYYAGGRPFYDLIGTLNTPATRQAASYFCLRTPSDKYQLIGVDTGINDRSPGLAFTPTYRGPTLRPSEAEWVRDKVANFPGQTLMFSHHQAFSAHSAINGPQSGVTPYVNKPLINTIEVSQKDKVALWMWGHEHNLALFEDRQYSVKRGRLVGCSAFETRQDEDPYKVVFKDVKVESLRLAREGPWVDHGCAVIDLGPETITYWQIAAWTGDQPDPRPQLIKLKTEGFGT